MLSLLVVFAALSAPPEKPQLDLEKFIIEDYNQIVKVVDEATELSKPRRTAEAFKELARRTAGKEMTIRIEVSNIAPSTERRGAYEIEGEILHSYKNPNDAVTINFPNRWHLPLSKKLAEQIEKKSILVVSGDVSFAYWEAIEKEPKAVSVFYPSSTSISLAIYKPRFSLPKD